MSINESITSHASVARSIVGGIVSGQVSGQPSNAVPGLCPCSAAKCKNRHYRSVACGQHGRGKLSYARFSHLLAC